MYFYGYNLKKIKIGLILIDLNQIFRMKPLEFIISLSVESYDKKFGKLSKLLHCRKAHGF